MANTTSWAFPSMIDVARNHVAIVEDNTSVVNRTRLLILTEPTELYNSPTFGVGLKKYLWQYNTPNVQAVIKDRIRDQLREHEPCVDADATSFSDGLLFTGSTDPLNTVENYNQLKMTVGLQTVYGDHLTIDLDFADLQDKIDYAQTVVSSLTE